MKYNKEFNTNNQSELEKLLALMFEEFEAENNCHIEKVDIKRGMKAVEYKYYTEWEHPVESVRLIINEN